MKKLLIFPYNGNGLEAMGCLSDEYEFIGFIDDDIEKQGTRVKDYDIFSRDIINKYPEAKILAVPGSPVTYLQRKDIIESLRLPEDRFATVISPKASVSNFSKIGYNVLIMAGVVITSNAVIKNHICILPNSIIHHDVEIFDFCLIGSNVAIAGNVRIRANSYIGSGTNVINNVTIGERSLVGLGSNVIASVMPNSKVAGNPAKEIGKSI